MTSRNCLTLCDQRVARATIDTVLQNYFILDVVYKQTPLTVFNGKCNTVIRHKTQGVITSVSNLSPVQLVTNNQICRLYL